MTATEQKSMGWRSRKTSPWLWILIAMTSALPLCNQWYASDENQAEMAFNAINNEAINRELDALQYLSAQEHLQQKQQQLIARGASKAELAQIAQQLRESQAQVDQSLSNEQTESDKLQVASFQYNKALKTDERHQTLLFFILLGGAAIALMLFWLFEGIGSPQSARAA